MLQILKTIPFNQLKRTSLILAALTKNLEYNYEISIGRHCLEFRLTDKQKETLVEQKLGHLENINGLEDLSVDVYSLTSKRVIEFQVCLSPYFLRPGALVYCTP